HLTSIGLVGVALAGTAACGASPHASGSNGGAGGQSATTAAQGAGGQTSSDTATSDTATGATGATSAGTTSSGGTGSSSAAEVAKKLGRSTHFLIGMGNDLNNDHSKDGAYTLGVTLDIHYAYLVGLQGQNGWPDWNSGGTFVNILTDSADKAGVVPMFTLYAMAAKGEGNIGALTDDSYMTPYWDGAKLLFQRL